MTKPLLFAALVFAAGLSAETLVTTRQGDEIPVSLYPADGDRLILWLSSEFGSTPRREALARRLAARGIEVWAPDLHASWFLPVGRYSLNGIDPMALVDLLGATIERSRKQVFLMAEGRSVGLALNSVRRWQEESDATSALGGLLAISPKLFERTPQGGEPAEYLPVAAASNLPIYLLQPEASGGFWRIGQVVSELETGGAPVFLHRLPAVSDGFHARAEFSEQEQAMTARLPAILDRATQQLQGFGGTPPTPAPLRGELRAASQPKASALLRPYPRQRQAPALQLPTLKGGEVELAALRGQVVLVNFWATWCPPCVEEIPSLQRLYHRLHDDGLEILAVDVGETRAQMEAFLADKPIDFPVLLDTHGAALKRWGIYAFPTTLVLDRRHRIRYAVFGAFDWNSPEVTDTLAPLLADRDQADR